MLVNSPDLKPKTLLEYGPYHANLL